MVVLLLEHGVIASIKSLTKKCVFIKMTLPDPEEPPFLTFNGENVYVHKTLTLIPDFLTILLLVFEEERVPGDGQLRDPLKGGLKPCRLLPA